MWLASLGAAVACCGCSLLNFQRELFLAFNCCSLVPLRALRASLSRFLQL